MSKKILESDLSSFSNFQTNSGFTKKLSLRLAKITAVYPDDNTVDVQWMFPNRGGMEKLELTKPYVGFKSGINFIPQVGSLVTVGFAEDLPILLTYFIPTSFSNMLTGIKNTDGLNTQIRKLQEGEISIGSSEQAEIYFHKKLELTDQTNDKIIIDPTDGSISIDSLQTYIENEAGKLTMGMVKRNNVIITNDGLPITSTFGGNALTEFRLSVNKLSDNTINNDAQTNELIADIFVGTKVNEDGKIAKTTDDTKINLEINMSTGVILQIDEKGKLFLNSNKVNINNGVENKSTSIAGPTQQRAAREGDRISIPLTALTNPNTTHPNLNDKALFNIAQLTQFATCFMSPAGPCTFVPTVSDIKLVGEITQGSNEVFIGSIDKQAETTESKDNTKP